jgi:hypothetical protein
MKTIKLKTSILTIVMLKGFSYNNAFRFTITGNGYSDETIIRMLDGATEDFDGSYDAWKLFSPNPNVPSIYSRVSPGQELAINSLPEYASDKSVALFANVPVTGYYTVTIQEVYPLMANYKISLTDLSSNVHYQIVGDTSITFFLTAQQGLPTFNFNISTAVLISTIDETCSESNDGVLNITKLGNLDWEYQIIDNNGVTVEAGLAYAETITYAGLASGNYLTRITSFGIVEEQSFTINPASFHSADFDLNSDTLLLSEGAMLDVINNSANATAYFWDFGDGTTSSVNNPTHTYLAEGSYNVKLIAYNNNCSKELEKTVVVINDQTLPTSVNETENQDNQLLALGQNRFKVLTKNVGQKLITLYNLEGKVVLTDTFNSDQYQFSLSNYHKGLYILTVTTADKSNLLKIKLMN